MEGGGGEQGWTLSYLERLSALSNHNEIPLSVGGGGEGGGGRYFISGVVGPKSPKENNLEGERRRGRTGLDVISFRKVVGSKSPK